MSNDTNVSALQTPNDNILGYFIGYTTTDIKLTPAEFEKHLAAAGLTGRVEVCQPHTPEAAFDGLALDGRPLGGHYAVPHRDQLTASLLVRTPDGVQTKSSERSETQLVRHVVREIRETSHPEAPIVDTKVLAQLVLNRATNEAPAHFEVLEDWDTLAEISLSERAKHIDGWLTWFTRAYTTATTCVPGDPATSAIGQLLDDAGAINLQGSNPTFLRRSRHDVVEAIERLLASLPRTHSIVAAPVTDTPAARSFLTAQLSLVLQFQIDDISGDVEWTLDNAPDRTKLTDLRKRLTRWIDRADLYRDLITDVDWADIELMKRQVTTNLDPPPGTQRATDS